jgi:hypothetical protein
MINKVFEKMLSLIIMEEQIKMSVRYHCTPVRIATIKKTKITNAHLDVKKGELYWWKSKLV